jgi:hypothetical protein
MSAIADLTLQSQFPFRLTDVWSAYSGRTSDQSGIAVESYPTVSLYVSPVVDPKLPSELCARLARTSSVATFVGQ